MEHRCRCQWALLDGHGAEGDPRPFPSERQGEVGGWGVPLFTVNHEFMEEIAGAKPQRTAGKLQCDKRRLPEDVFLTREFTETESALKQKVNEAKNMSKKGEGQNSCSSQGLEQEMQAPPHVMGENQKFGSETFIRDLDWEVVFIDDNREGPRVK